MTDLTQPVAERPQHEILIDQFMALDQQCQELISKINSGNILYECLPTEGAPDLKTLMEKMVAKYHQVQEYAKGLVDQRNTLLQEIATTMRAKVMAADNVVRGPDGKATVLKYGPFEASSKTFRSFNVEKAEAMLQAIGQYGRFCSSTFIDKDTGQAVPILKVEKKIDYKHAEQFFLEQNLKDIRENTYEEEEGTPAVTGPKPIAWIGEVDKTARKGKK